MHAKATKYTPPTDKAALEAIPSQNSAAVEELMASQLLVEHCQDIIPPEGLEEGEPVSWGFEPERIPIAPHGDYATGKSSGRGASLKGVSDV